MCRFQSAVENMLVLSPPPLYLSFQDIISPMNLLHRITVQDVGHAAIICV